MCVIKKLACTFLRIHSRVPAGTWEKLKFGAILTANHVSFLDGILISLVSPVRMVYAVDTEFSIHSPAASKGLEFLRRIGLAEAIVPMDQGSPFGMRSLLKALDKGYSVMIFPEGRISDDGRPNQDLPGVDWLAKRSGKEIIRLEIRGAEKSRFFGKSGREVWPRIEVRAA